MIGEASRGQYRTAQTGLPSDPVRQGPTAVFGGFARETTISVEGLGGVPGDGSNSADELADLARDHHVLTCDDHEHRDWSGDENLIAVA